MICPICRDVKLKCIDTACGGLNTGRRYRCNKCNEIFYSYEYLIEDVSEESKPLTLLSEKSRKKYSRSKRNKSENRIDKNLRL